MTLIKAMLNMVCPDSGSIALVGHDFRKEEEICKQDIGVVLGGIDFYPLKKVKSITSITRRFYKEWDENTYDKFLHVFEIDPEKQFKQLSAGMRVKYLIAVALSHKAKLFILDEPTSGLDPVSRDELLDLFKDLVKSGERSILFSTHITTDLEKCADDITYIHLGEILRSAPYDKFMASFQNLRNPGDKEPLTLQEIMVRTERGKSNAKFDF